MKKIIIYFVLIPVLLFSQEREILSYYIVQDTLIGVKNETGKIIISATIPNYGSHENGEKIRGNVIEFDAQPIDMKREKNAWGSVFDRNGNFLYQPFLYDNGNDYFVEGVRRYVKDEKVGFVDQNGIVIIEAKHDFVTPFNYGYAKFCDGCDWENTHDEHRSIVGGVWGVINWRGQQVNPIKPKYIGNEVEIDGEMYPYPFSYNEKEEKILQFFEKQNAVLSDIFYVNHYPAIPKNQKKLYFEIVERPKDNFPYYRVNSYDNTKMHSFLDSFDFLVSEDGKEILQIGYEDNIPFEQWLIQEKLNAKEYQQKNKDIPNKITHF